MIRSLPLLFLAGVAVEIASIIWVGDMLGVVPTLLLLLAGGVIGMSLMKSAGTSVVSALRSPVQERSLPQGLGSTALARGFAGLLFMIPGFVSDAAALLLLLPPVQHWLRSKVKVESFTTAPPPPRRYDHVIEGEVIEIVGEVEPPPHREPPR